MKKIIILFCCFILISNFVIAQQLGKKDDNKNPLNQQQNLNIQTPKIDFTNMDILKQIEPSSSTNMLYNDQLLEGPINADLYVVGPNDVFALGVWGVLNIRAGTVGLIDVLRMVISSVICR